MEIDKIQEKLKKSQFVKEYKDFKGQGRSILEIMQNDRYYGDALWYDLVTDQAKSYMEDNDYWEEHCENQIDCCCEKLSKNNIRCLDCKKKLKALIANENKREQWVNEQAQFDIQCQFDEINTKNDEEVASFYGKTSEIKSVIRYSAGEICVDEIMGFCDNCDEPLIKVDFDATICEDCEEIECDCGLEGDVKKISICPNCGEQIKTEEEKLLDAI